MIWDDTLLTLRYVVDYPVVSSGIHGIHLYPVLVVVFYARDPASVASYGGGSSPPAGNRRADI